MRTLLSILLISITLSFAAALAPLLGVGRETTIPDEYIVVLNEGTVEMRDSHVRELQAVLGTVKVKSTFDIGTFIGFTAVMDKNALARELEHEDVKLIEANNVVTLAADDSITQETAEWGLDRSSQRDLPLDQKFQFWESSGRDVDAYVLDTGILATHNDLKGRVFPGANFIAGETDSDCNGHGTHVASTIGGTQFGLAKLVSLFPVKVLACSGSGSYAGVISGIEWTAKSHETRTTKRSVANMSLGGGISAAVDNAVTAAIAKGVAFFIAAGNNYGANACNYSPARTPDAVTVGATQLGDARSSYSNIGPCVDIFAPGTNIQGAWWTADDATNTISGTSMATPHVAGAAALYLGHLAAANPDATATPAEVTKYLIDNATPDKITSVGANTVNLLLFSPYQ